MKLLNHKKNIPIVTQSRFNREERTNGYADGNSIDYRYSSFTLLEILVVIGIIAILVTMGFVSYSTAQKKARDARRQSDLRSISSCLEQYYSYNNNFEYPIIVDGDLASSLSCGGTTFTTPTDPKTNGAYQVTASDSDGSTYTICSPVVSGSSRLETADCTTGSNCCVSNQQ